MGAACISAEARQYADPKIIGPDAASSAAIRVGLVDYAFELETTSAPAGVIDFIAENKGTDFHEFVIVRRLGDHYDLPYGEIEAMEPGETGAIRADLAAGSYALVCLIVSVADGEPQSHMALGMFAPFEVTK